MRSGMGLNGMIVGKGRNRDAYASFFVYKFKKLFIFDGIY